LRALHARRFLTPDPNFYLQKTHRNSQAEYGRDPFQRVVTPHAAIADTLHRTDRSCCSQPSDQWPPPRLLLARTRVSVRCISEGRGAGEDCAKRVPNTGCCHVGPTGVIPIDVACLHPVPFLRPLVLGHHRIRGYRLTHFDNAAS
jgi:hypothetical protein